MVAFLGPLTVAMTWAPARFAIWNGVMSHGAGAALYKNRFGPSRRRQENGLVRGQKGMPKQAPSSKLVLSGSGITYFAGSTVYSAAVP